MGVLPRYPIYVPSKGRETHQLAPTFGVLDRDNVPYFAVVEPQERDAYIELVGVDRVLILPFSNLGQGSIPARNWIKDHAVAGGHARHWQLDDNIQIFRRLYKGKRIPCSAGIALRVCEDFSDRYDNIGVSGLNYQMFVTNETRAPYFLNCHVYSCTLLNSAIPHRWRGRYNEDTDICLQVLADNWCTVLVNVFMADKRTTMVTRGGNMDELYKGDGRLKMARALARAWPGVVSVDRRWQRPQHVVHSSWRKFDTPLIRREDIDRSKMPTRYEYGMDLKVMKDIKSPSIERILEEWRASTPTPTEF